MYFSTVAAAGLLTLAALTPAPADAQPSRVRADEAAYRALGTEPFWGLTIDARTMRFESPNLRGAVTVDTPQVIHGFAGEIYQTRRMNVNVVHKSCSDGMSERTYADTVTVTLDGQTYKGCGGAGEVAVEPERSAIEGDWRVLTVAGRPVVRGTNVTINFRGYRVNGNTGCNSFGGGFQLRRGRLTTGPMITTKRACTRFIGTQERDLLGLLGERLSVSENRNGRLVLTGRGGRTLVLEPVRGRRERN